MQMWFETPAFLVELFRKVNPGVEVVSSDPVMDPLRMVKDDGELALMTEAQRVAGIGMDRARELLRPGVTAHEIATEATYAMMRAGAERTSTPIYVTFGIETCMLHGRLSPRPLQRGELAVIDLTPQVEGYCANLARTFVLGEPDERQRALLDAYAERDPRGPRGDAPGSDRRATRRRSSGAVLERHGLGAYHVHGIGHGLGLRFEETPASTIIPPHRNVPLREGMTMTIGHTVLAIPGFGGVRHEDVYRVTPTGGEILCAVPDRPGVDGFALVASQPMGTTEPIHESDPDQAPDSDFEPGDLAPPRAGQRGPDARHPANPGQGRVGRSGPRQLRGRGARVRGPRRPLAVRGGAGLPLPVPARRPARRCGDGGSPDGGGREVRPVPAHPDRPSGAGPDAGPPAGRGAQGRGRARRRSARIDLGGRLGDASVQRALHDYLATRGLTDLEAGSPSATSATRHPASWSRATRSSSPAWVSSRTTARSCATRTCSPASGARSGAPSTSSPGSASCGRCSEAAGHDRVWLYRGLAADGPLGVPPARTFVSTTFDRAVAESVAGRGPATVVSVLIGQLVPVDRVFMTFIETAELNRVYHEAEAILLADRRNRAF